MPFRCSAFSIFKQLQQLRRFVNGEIGIQLRHHFSIGEAPAHIDGFQPRSFRREDVVSTVPDEKGFILLNSRFFNYC